MVRVNYEAFEEHYASIRQAACGRQACSVLILVALEVDAMAATKMLTQLLRADNIAYTIRPVSNFDEVKVVVQTNMTADIKSVFLINCGAIYDIPKCFDLENGGDVRCFLMDNHRPFHLKNVHSHYNVVCFDENYIYEDDDDDDIPSEASVMSSNVGDRSDDDTLNSEDEEESLGDEEEEDFNDFAELEGAPKQADDEDEEFDADSGDENNDNDADNEEDEDAVGEEAEEVDDGEEEGAGNEGKDGEDDGEDILDDESDTSAGKPPSSSQISKPKKNLIDDDDEEEEGSQVVNNNNSKLDTTFVADWKDTDGTKLSQPDKKKKKLRKNTILDDDDDDAMEEEGLEDDEQIEEVEGEGEEGDANEMIEDDEEDGNLDKTRDLFDENDDEGPINRKMAFDEDEDEPIRFTGKRRRRAELDAKRQKKSKIRSYYSRAITHASPTALMLLPQIRTKFSAYGHIPLDIMWQAILGITDQYTRGRSPEDIYDSYCDYLKLNLTDHLETATERVNYNIQEVMSTEGGVATIRAGTNANPTENANTITSITVPGAQTGHIELSSDYRFFLYRHWSLYDSMFHSVYIASKFSIWNSRGKSRVNELLAEMGVPLQQCKQSFQYMNPQTRDQFRNQLQTNAVIRQKYHLANPDVMFKSFCRFSSYRNPLAALDIVYAATALLELYTVDPMAPPSSSNNTDPTANTTNPPPSLTFSVDTKQSTNTFFDAYALLGTRNDELIKKGISLALDIQQTIVKKASAMLDGQDTIHRYHRIYYAYLKNNFHQGNAHVPTTKTSLTATTTASSSSSASHHKELELIFGRPMVLAKLGQFIMEVKRNLPRKDGGWTGSNLLPLILLSERYDGRYLIMGISPLTSLSSSTDTTQQNISEEQKEKLAPLINFRQFFKLAAKDMTIPIHFNSFDPNVVLVEKADAQDFLGALDNALRKATPNFFTNQAHQSLKMK